MKHPQFSREFASWVISQIEAVCNRPSMYAWANEAFIAIVVTHLHTINCLVPKNRRHSDFYQEARDVWFNMNNTKQRHSPEAFNEYLRSKVSHEYAAAVFELCIRYINSSDLFNCLQ